MAALLILFYSFIKSSILLQYLSIASGARIQRWMIKGLLVFVILFSLLTTIVSPYLPLLLSIAVPRALWWFANLQKVCYTTLHTDP